MSKKIIGLFFLLIVSLVFGYLGVNKDNETILMDSKINSKQKNLFLSMMIETGSNTGIYEESNNSTWNHDGYTFNETLSKCENGGTLLWDEGTKQVIMSTTGSDKCYVFFDKLSQVYYWNDGFRSNNYAFPNIPSEKTYSSVEALRDGYGINYFNSKPVYIKTTETEHLACLYYETTGKEFCLSRNYWDTDDATTKAKIQTAMATALGINESSLSCSSDSSFAYCRVPSLYCAAHSNSSVECYGTAWGCVVNDVGVAYCYEEN